jgi:hypothetical protein
MGRKQWASVAVVSLWMLVVALGVTGYVHKPAPETQNPRAKIGAGYVVNGVAGGPDSGLIVQNVVGISDGVWPLGMVDAGGGNGAALVSISSGGASPGSPTPYVTVSPWLNVQAGIVIEAGTTFYGAQSCCNTANGAVAGWLLLFNQTTTPVTDAALAAPGWPIYLPAGGCHDVGVSDVTASGVSFPTGLAFGLSTVPDHYMSTGVAPVCTFIHNPW